MYLHPPTSTLVTAPAPRPPTLRDCQRLGREGGFEEGYEQSANSTSHEREAVRQGSVFQRQDLRRDGLNDGNRCERRADKYPSTYQHAHRCCFGGDYCTDEGDERGYRCEIFSVEDVG